MSNENEYVDVIKKCFQGYDDKSLKMAFDAAEEIQGELNGDFRGAIKKHLEDKGYSKKKLKDFMELYDAVFAIGNSTGATMFALATDTVKTNHLFDF